MTVASSSTYEFTIDRVVLRAFQLAGVMGIEEEPIGIQWEKRVSFGREMLEMLIKRLETEARLSRARRMYDLQLVEAIESYDLPEGIMDVYGDGALIDPATIGTGAQFETVVSQISQEDWQRLGTRNTVGRPSLYWCDRAQAPLKIRLWQAPDALSVGVIRFQVYSFLANSTEGEKTPDLERYWALFLTYGLATIIAEASSLSRDKVMGLRTDAELYMQKCKMYSRQRTPMQAVVYHPYWRN